MREFPWITDGAFNFMKEYLQSKEDPKIFEWGSGGSTIWLAQNFTDVITLEDNKSWFRKVRKELEERSIIENVQLLLRARGGTFNSAPYTSSILELPDESLDFVLIDGRDRVNCVRAAIEKVKPGGVIMVDNFERKGYRKIAKILSEWEYSVDVQVGKDHTGWIREGKTDWTTAWWIKPMPL